MSMDVGTLLVRESVRELLGGYVHHMDRGRTEEFLELFAEDGVWEIVSDGFDGGRFAGRDAIRSHLESMKTASTDDVPLRHHVTSVRVWVDGPGEARADAYFTAFTTTDGPDHWGRYRDRVVEDGDRWRFAQRSVIHEGRVPGGWLERRNAAAVAR
ncbi:MAG: nuclear transport factor 2 family protein [Solirubrobacteraceae bacterium]